jgi:hypothetical protein
VFSGGNLTSATAKVLIALFALSCVSRAHPWRPHRHTPDSATSNTVLNPIDGYHLDNDIVPSRVTLESNGLEKTIHIRFGNSHRHVGFSAGSNEDGKLVAGDIDHDGDVDLIWLGGAEHRRAVVLINQGEGDFVEADDNAPYSVELDELFSTGDQPNNRLIKHRPKPSTLTSSTFSDIARTLPAELHVPEIKISFVNTAEPKTCSLGFLKSDPQRGPPSILS